MIIGQLGADNWQALRNVRLAALAESPGNFFRSLDEEQAQPEAHWRDLLALKNAALFGAFDRDTLVGITGVFTDRDDPTGRTAALGMTWLDAAWRQQGIGHRFYDVRLGWARRCGFARVAVSHRASNEPSRRAMLRAGFHEVGRATHHWPDGVTEDDVRYELVLGEGAVS